jgi:hypothetical protein
VEDRDGSHHITAKATSELHICTSSSYRSIALSLLNHPRSKPVAFADLIVLLRYTQDRIIL